MKKPLLIVLMIFFIICAFYVLKTGEIDEGSPATIKNISHSIQHALIRVGIQRAPVSNLTSTHSADTLLLLVSDNNANKNFVQAWTMVAAEEGLHLDVMSDSDFMDQSELNYRGIILSDSIHKDIRSEVSKKIMNYIAFGGSLFLIYDAATQSEANSTIKKYPLMSALLGINCGKEDTLSACISVTTPVGSNPQQLATLGVPPGKCMVTSSNSSNRPLFCALSSQEYGVLQYNHFLIKTTDSSPALLTTPDNQTIAMTKSFGKGSILFVNLPLTYLWAQTDAMLMHTFLHYYADTLLNLPLLATVPNGVGGIILNLHVESIDALAGFSILEKMGLFKQGPFSIDFTAGPGLDTADDKRGLDVLNNQETQNWMHYVKKLGNAVGSDGGWLHNYYGKYASETNQKEFQYYIQINNEAIERVLNEKVLEYVPCDGNQPTWATRYLEQQGFLGYYTTSNTGSAPTQNFRNGVFDKDSLWSFPVLPFEKGACFRDFGRTKVSEPDVTQWLIDSTHFVTTNHTSRLIYFHPTDILYYPQFLVSMQTWLTLTEQLHQQGIFQWYSMVNLSQFLNARRNVDWQVTHHDNLATYSANHPTNLINQTWLIKKNSCSKPRIIDGNGLVKENDSYWQVLAGTGQRIKFTCNLN